MESYRARIKEGKRNVVVLLEHGNRAPIMLLCVNPFCRHRAMMKVNHDIKITIQDSQGVHWADLPDNVTVVEHRCRGCGYQYKIYTPDTEASAEEVLTAMSEAKSNV